MDKSESFKQFLSASSANVSMVELLIGIVLSLALSLVLAKVYVKCGRSLSNRDSFSKNFPLITVTTFLIITIVKSSLALSLGLVGALSIIRFRTAIKEPEELAYMFISIAIGLGLGANQVKQTVIATLVIFLFAVIRHRFEGDYMKSNLFLNIESNDNELDIKRISQLLQDDCNMIDLRRYSLDSDRLDASFRVELKDLSSLSNVKAKLVECDSKVKIDFIDSTGLEI